MVFHRTSTRVLFLGFIVFAAISVYILVATHHLRLPQVELSYGGGHARDKLAVDSLHHLLLEDFAKYDQDRDSKLSVHEFAEMLREAKGRASAAAIEKELRAGGGLDGGGGGGGRRRHRGGDDGEYDDIEEYDKGYDEEDGDDDGALEYDGEPDSGDDYDGDVGEDGGVLKHVSGGEKQEAKGGDAKGAAAGGGGTGKGSATAASPSPSPSPSPTAAPKATTPKATAAAAAGGGAGAGASTTAAPKAAAAATTAPAATKVAADTKAGAATTAAAATKPANTKASAAATATATTAATAATSSAPSASSPGCPDLSREHVAQFARNNTIMLTVADWRIFGTMGINWMKHLAKWNVDYYLVGATDKKTAQFLGHTGKHPCFKFYEDGAHAGSDEYRYGDSHYNAATWRKVVVVSRMVHWGFNVIHSDVDVVWFRDPLPYFLGPQLSKVDIAVSSDLISTQNQVGDDGLEAGMHQHTNFNTGVYFVRSSPGGKSFMAGWAAMRKTNFRENDQVGVYGFIRGRPAKSEQRMLVLMPNAGEAEAAAAFAANPDTYDRRDKKEPLPVSTEMRLGGLAVHMMLNGYSYFIPKLHTRMNVSSLGIHMTWVPLSKEGKFHRFRDGMLYDDPDEYYDAPGLRFLTADIEAPDAPEGFNSWRETEDMIQVHLKNMPPQLKQVYRAVAVSLMLNRTLIFPKIRCFCFKNWFMSEQCRIPGDKVTQFPLDCALDQVFRPKVLYNYPPLATRAGPLNFTFREYSFLDNPRTPASVKSGQVLVLPEGADAGNTTGYSRVVRVKPGMGQDELVKALEAVKDAKVIRLRHPLQILGGFSDQVLKKSVDTFARDVTANWCCRDEPYIAKGMAKKVKMVMEW